MRHAGAVSPKAEIAQDLVAPRVGWGHTRGMLAALRWSVVVAGVALGVGGAGRGWGLQAADSPKTPAVPATAASASPTMTLHLYTDDLQIPVLVLSPSLGPLKPVAANRFAISLDGGPLFPPTHVRREGDDPISLAVLIDPEGQGKELAGRLDEALAGLARGSLEAQDRVSVYAMNCVLTRSAYRITPSAEGLKKAVDVALGDALRSPRHSAKCQHGMELWDSMEVAVAELAPQPGRRVLLTVSDGVDRGSTRPWAQVRELAQVTSVAVVGLKPEEEPTLLTRDMPAPQNSGTMRILFPGRVEDPFQQICELSGGVVLYADGGPRPLDKAVRDIAAMVRDRYILEFPRARNSTAGRHGLTVRIAHSDAYIRTAGISVPLPSADEQAARAVQNGGVYEAPVQGNRRILEPSH